MLRTTGLCSD